MGIIGVIYRGYDIKREGGKYVAYEGDRKTGFAANHIEEVQAMIDEAKRDRK